MWSVFLPFVFTEYVNLGTTTGFYLPSVILILCIILAFLARGLSWISLFLISISPILDDYEKTFFSKKISPIQPWKRYLLRWLLVFITGQVVLLVNLCTSSILAGVFISGPSYTSLVQFPVFSAHMGPVPLFSFPLLMAQVALASVLAGSNPKKHPVKYPLVTSLLTLIFIAFRQIVEFVIFRMGWDENYSLHISLLRVLINIALAILCIALANQVKKKKDFPL